MKAEKTSLCLGLDSYYKEGRQYTRCQNNSKEKYLKPIALLRNSSSIMRTLLQFSAMCAVTEQTDSPPMTKQVTVQSTGYPLFKSIQVRALGGGFLGLIYVDVGLCKPGLRLERRTPLRCMIGSWCLKLWMVKKKKALDDFSKSA